MRTPRTFTGELSLLDELATDGAAELEEGEEGVVLAGVP